MGRKLDLLGQRFGRLVVIRDAGRDKRQRVKWECQCDCGQTRVVHSCNLTAGRQQSCGCLRDQRRAEIAEARTKHGHSRKGQRTRAYESWTGMVKRCTNPNARGWDDYGGRGVAVCDRWNPSAGGSFENFLADMGEPPEGTSIDKDKLGGIGCLLYSPENCCWLNRSGQARYTRKGVFVTYKGQRMHLLEAAELSGVCSGTIRTRIHRGWPESRLFEPVKR